MTDETPAEGAQRAATDIHNEGARWLRWLGALLFVVLVALGATLWTLRSVDAHVDRLEVEVSVLKENNAQAAEERQQMQTVLAFIDRLLCERLPDATECQDEGT